MMVLSNMAFSSGSLLRGPNRLPRPNLPPWKRGPYEHHARVTGFRGSLNFNTAESIAPTNKGSITVASYVGNN